MTPRNHAWLDSSEDAGQPAEEDALAQDLLHLAGQIQPSDVFTTRLRQEITTRAANQPVHSPRRQSSRLGVWALRLGSAALFAALLFAVIRLIPPSQPGSDGVKPLPEPTPSRLPTAVPTPPPGILVAAPLENCQQMQTAMQQEFGFSFELKSDAPFNSTNLNPFDIETSGRACGVFAQAEGSTFQDARALRDRMKSIAIQQGYDQIKFWEETNFGKLQPGGVVMNTLAVHNDQRAYLSLTWMPNADAVCATADAYSSCQFSPVQGTWNLAVTLAMDPISSVVTEFVDRWLASDPSVAEVSTKNGEVTGLITKTFQFDLGDQPIAALDQLLGVTSHNRLTYIPTYVDESYTGDHVRVNLTLFERQPGNASYSLPDHDLLLVKDSSGTWRINGIEPVK